MSRPRIYLFGDDHTDTWETVKERLLSVIPEDADLIVIEHPEKGDDRAQPSNWIWVKNPSLLFLQFISSAVECWMRWQANRVVHRNQKTVAEEVAEEAGIPVAFTGVSWPNRIDAQPAYLTISSWMAFLMIFLGWLVHSGFLLGGVLIVPVVAFISQKVIWRIREAKMAEDLLEYGQEKRVMVYFTGDSHIEPVANRVDDELDVRIVPTARAEG